MKEWIASTMKCKVCRSSIKATYISKTTVGIASRLHFKCESEKCKAREKETMEAETVVLRGETHDNRSKSSVTRFTANWRLLAATQLFGESQKAGEIVTSFLDLAPSAFRRPWWKMEEELALAHDHVTSEIIEENLEAAVQKQRGTLHNDHVGKVPLTVSFDMGWQKRGMSFNSLSGHAFIIDVGTGKVIGKRLFSKSCRKCATSPVDVPPIIVR
jgi:hypothetical protein